jgi:hypothetical protein
MARTHAVPRSLEPIHPTRVVLGSTLTERPHFRRSEEKYSNCIGLLSSPPSGRCGGATISSAFASVTSSSANAPLLCAVPARSSTPPNSRSLQTTAIVFARERERWGERERYSHGRRIVPPPAPASSEQRHRRRGATDASSTYRARRHGRAGRHARRRRDARRCGRIWRSECAREKPNEVAHAQCDSFTDHRESTELLLRAGSSKNRVTVENSTPTFLLIAAVDKLCPAKARPATD